MVVAVAGARPTIVVSRVPSEGSSSSILVIALLSFGLWNQHLVLVIACDKFLEMLFMLEGLPQVPVRSGWFNPNATTPRSL
jgi:hypothetical protein